MGGPYKTPLRLVLFGQKQHGIFNIKVTKEVKGHIKLSILKSEIVK